METRREPSQWAEELNKEVRGAADRAGRQQKPDKRIEMEGQVNYSRRKEHECTKKKVGRIHHWFGSSSSEESGVDEDEEPWSTVEKEKRNKVRKIRTKEKMDMKKKELTLKARRMAGVGPITSQELEEQRKRTNSYSQAKIWAIKAHLARHYRYNQQELDELEILETKRNVKDDIIYLAVANEDDIRNIYFRKAECRSDDTIVKNFIPPQYWERFAALNRLCAKRREEDDKLKTRYVSVKKT